MNPIQNAEMVGQTLILDTDTVVNIACDGRFERGLTGSGVALLKKGDHYVDVVGQGIAYGRALQDLGKQVEERWLARSVTELEVKAKHGDSMAQFELAFRRISEALNTAFGGEHR